MSNYRSDQLLKILERIDVRSSEEDDPIALAENTIQDLFFPLSEELTMTDTVEVATYTASAMCWGDGLSTDAGWTWEGGGRWT